MKQSNYKTIIRIFFIFIIVFTLFLTSLLQVSSQEKVKYTDLEKDEFSEDEETQELLQEYYGKLLGFVKKRDKFNTIAEHESLAILNVTINGKDKRIFTRLRTGILFPAQGGKLITAENLVVLGNISLKGVLFNEIGGNYGPRSLFSLASTKLSFVDEGFARLVNGKANVSINPILRELISSYSVFLSAEGLTKGLYVAEKTNGYFVVKSLNVDSNVGFSWMLRGLRNDFETGYLTSNYAKENSISIIATINYENGTTEIKIKGLSNIFRLINESINVTLNESLDNINATIDQNTNQNDSNLSILAIIGNVIDEFGLENDLSSILGEPTILPTISEGIADETNANEDTAINEPTTTDKLSETIDLEDSGLNDVISNEIAIELKDPIGVNETAQKTDLAFTLFSTNEDFILKQISEVTGLSLEQSRKLVNFVYTNPENFVDETLEETFQFPDWITKVNGSIKLRLG